jgi:hypothetical protein
VLTSKSSGTKNTYHIVHQKELTFSTSQSNQETETNLNQSIKLGLIIIGQAS